MVLVWAIAFTVATGVESSTAQALGQRDVIEGRVVDAETQEPPREPVTVTYQEHGDVDYEPVLADTDPTTGHFQLVLEPGTGEFGLISVRQPGYNSALLVWPVPVDTDVVMYLSRPVWLRGAIVNESGMPVSGAMVKWSMEHDGRLVSGVQAADSEGFFHVDVPRRADDLRIAAWAEHYVPARASYVFDVDHGEPPPTVLRSLESQLELRRAIYARGETVARGETGDRYLEDWVDEILLTHGAEPPR